ncbi:MAG TPA: protein kinase, partial [Steroidobacteraceae bacterium]
MDLFRSIQLKLAQRELGATTDGQSVDLYAPSEPSLTEPPLESAALPEPQEIQDAWQDTTPEPGLKIGLILRERYEIVNRLGSGRNGTVYKALDWLRSEHPDVDSHVAIKVLNRDARALPEILSKMRREFYDAQKLSHRSVVKVFELDRDQDFTFFTMELIEGDVLSNVLQKFHSRALPRDYVWAMLREVGDGLAHAHERRVIHGDLRPQNIMVTNSGELRILDFGTSGKSATAMMPAYASCEVLEGREPDPRDDLFALACLAYELLSGNHPFQQRLATEARAFNAVPQRPPGLSSRQWSALTLGLAWEREGRAVSVRDWLIELNPGVEPLGPIPQPQDFKPVRKTKGHATPTRLVAILAALIISMVTWVVLHQPAGKVDVIDDTAAEPAASVATVDMDALNSQIAESQPLEDETPDVPKVIKKPRSAGVSAARPVDKTQKIGIAAGMYRIAPGQKFAEIQVHRSQGSNADTSFEWWTEPASALEGVDYVPQTRATMSFPRGRQSASLFIKLLPNTSRKRSDVFYVVIGNPSSGS